MQAYPFRRIRSFVRREGRITQSQSLAFETLWPMYGLSKDAEGFLDLDKLFGRDSEKVLEIGFGDGQSLIQMAKNAPEKDFIGIEVYRTGVGNLLREIEKEQISNIRLFHGDALEIVESKIPKDSIATIQVFFADPWPKTRHHKRRLVQASFVELAAQKLKKGGRLHLATDWMDYAYHMMSVISAAGSFHNVAGEEAFLPRPNFRPLTKYEQRGLRLGHQTWDLLFERV